MTLVTNTLTISDATPKTKSYGKILIYAYLTAFAGTREYSADSDGLAGLVADGVSLDSEAYALASAICSQAPHVQSFKVAPAHAQTESYTLEIKDLVPGGKYEVWTQSKGDPAVLRSYTAPSNATLGSIATALAALMDDDTNVTVTVNNAVISVAPAVANDRIHVRGYTRNMSYTRVGTATNIATELTAINTADDDWYGLLIGWTSAVAIEAAATWAEANGKRFAAITSESAAMDPTSTTDVMSVLSSSNFARNMIYPTRDEGGRLDAAALGLWLAYAPPKVVTLHAKSVSGPIVDALTQTEKNAIAAKHGIAYYNESGIPMLHDGWASSGRFLDVTLLADWVVSSINEAIVQMLATQLNVPFNKVGEALVQDAISSVFTRAEAARVIAPKGDPDGGWEVNVQDTSKLTKTQRGQRKYPGSSYKFRILGSMHYLDVTGTMGV